MTGAIGRLAERLQYAAVTPALYLASLSLLSTPSASSLGLAAVGTGALAIYLIDRVGIMTGPQASDLDAEPARSEFLQRHALFWRTLALAAAASSCVMLFRLDPLLAAAPFLGLVATTLYRGEYATAPAKRLFIVKLPAASLALAAFAVLPQHAPITISSPPAIPLLMSALIVASDLILCDLDHRDADRRAGIHSLPVLTNASVSCATAIALIVLPGFWIGATLGSWPAATVILAGTLGAILRTRRRDVIEWRLVLASALFCV